MILQEFIDKYEGKYVDFDKAYGAQCFDLYRQYCQDVLEVPQSPPTGTQGAKKIWDTYLTDYFDRIENQKDNFPEPGDIVIWGDYGQFGHVAICNKATVNTLTCFSQNDPLGSNCQLKIYRSYKGVLGWLRKKKPTEPTIEAPSNKELSEQIKELKDIVNLLSEDREIIVDTKSKVASLDSKFDDLSKKFDSHMKDLKADVKEVPEKVEQSVHESVETVTDAVNKKDNVMLIVNKQNVLETLVKIWRSLWLKK